MTVLKAAFGVTIIYSLLTDLLQSLAVCFSLFDAATAAGNFLPPIFIFKGDLLMRSTVEKIF